MEKLPQQLGLPADCAEQPSLIWKFPGETQNNLSEFSDGDSWDLESGGGVVPVVGCRGSSSYFLGVEIGDLVFLGDFSCKIFAALR